MNCSLGCGIVFELKPSATGYVETILHRFNGGSDGQGPYAGLIADKLGALYGTTTGGGSDLCPNGCGTVFRVKPSGAESVLFSFQGGCDGRYPFGGLIASGPGALYGTADSINGMCPGAGIVFKLENSGTGYTERVIYSFRGPQVTASNRSRV